VPCSLFLSFPLPRVHLGRGHRLVFLSASPRRSVPSCCGAFRQRNGAGWARPPSVGRQGWLARRVTAVRGASRHPHICPRARPPHAARGGSVGAPPRSPRWRRSTGRQRRGDTPRPTLADDCTQARAVPMPCSRGRAVGVRPRVERPPPGGVARGRTVSRSGGGARALHPSDGTTPPASDGTRASFWSAKGAPKAPSRPPPPRGPSTLTPNAPPMHAAPRLGAGRVASAAARWPTPAAHHRRAISDLAMEGMAGGRAGVGRDRQADVNRSRPATGGRFLTRLCTCAHAARACLLGAIWGARPSARLPVAEEGARGCQRPALLSVGRLCQTRKAVDERDARHTVAHRDCAGSRGRLRFRGHGCPARTERPTTPRRTRNPCQRMRWRSEARHRPRPLPPSRRTDQSRGAFRAGAATRALGGP